MKKLSETFNEFDFHLVNDAEPSKYLKQLLPSGIFFDVYPFTMLGDLIKVEQSPEHHPEGNVWNHTMMVVDNAAMRRKDSKNPRALMWAALLHDLGKVPTTRVRKGKITAYDHDKAGEKLAAEFLSQLTKEDEFVLKVSKLVRWHMQILFVVKDLPFAEIKKMAEEVSIKEIALLSTCDRLGRGGMTYEKYNEEMENIRIFLEKCSKAIEPSM